MKITDSLAKWIQSIADSYHIQVPLLPPFFILIACLVGIITYVVLGPLTNLLLKKKYKIEKLAHLKRRLSCLISIVFFLQALPSLQLSSNNSVIANLIWGLHFVAFILIILLTNQLIEIIFSFLYTKQQKGYGNQLGIFQILKSVAKIGALSLVIILVPRFFVVYDLSKWLASFSVGAGTLTAIAALASKDLISNFFGALVILIGKPFKVGDWIIVNKLEGRVVSIDIRSTKLRTALGTFIHIPNGTFTSKHLENYGHVSAISMQFTVHLLTISQAAFDTFLQEIDQLIQKMPFLVGESSRIYLTDITAKKAKINFNLAFRTMNHVESIKYTRQFVEEVQKIAQAKKVTIE